MTVRSEERAKAMADVLTKIVQRAHSPAVRGSTPHVTCLVPAGLLNEAARALGINREF